MSFSIDPLSDVDIDELKRRFNEYLRSLQDSEKREKLISVAESLDGKLEYEWFLKGVLPPPPTLETLQKQNLVKIKKELSQVELDSEFVIEPKGRIEFYLYVDKIGPIDKAVYQILERYIDEFNLDHHIDLFNGIRTALKVYINARETQTKQTKSSKQLVSDFRKTVRRLTDIFVELDNSLDVKHEFDLTMYDLQYEDNLYKTLDPGGVTTIAREVVVEADYRQLPDEFEIADIYNLLTEEDKENLRYITKRNLIRRVREFEDTLFRISHALDNHQLSNIGGKGRKKDYLTEGFFYRIASNMFYELDNKYPVCDSPNSVFFKMIDELLSLAGVELADRSLRDRIGNFIYETGADKWGKST